LKRGWEEGERRMPTASAPRMEGVVDVEKMVPGYWPVEDVKSARNRDEERKNADFGAGRYHGD
jgi:hypothetical protein